MSKLKLTSDRKSLLPQKRLQRLAATLVIIIVAGVGAYLLSTSRAASDYGSVNASTGSLSGSATAQSDTKSSAGQYVRFGDTGAAGTYVDIYMPATALTSISNDVTVNNVPNLGSTTYFWSHQFGFATEPTSGGAYIGIQGINKAIFSLFDWASLEYSSNCIAQGSNFDGGTEPGTACYIPYTITQGDTYLLNVAAIGQDSNGINWQGTVTNLTTNTSSIIATFNVPTSWGYIAYNSVVWTEDFGAQVPDCSDLPSSNVTFSNFTADNGIYTAPESHSDIITQNECTADSSITDSSGNSFTEIMGGSPIPGT